MPVTDEDDQTPALQWLEEKTGSIEECGVFGIFNHPTPPL